MQPNLAPTVAIYDGPVTPLVSSQAGRIAGSVYLIASVGFLIVFTWLAGHFGYPDVLDHPASEVLPKLLQLGDVGRMVWVVYAILPLLLIPAAVGAATTLRRKDNGNDSVVQLGVLLHVIAAFAMTLGLARWSTAQWTLAIAWETADIVQRASITTLFDILNAYLGNGIGEFIGELALYSSFAAFGVALSRNGARWVSRLAFATSVAGLIGMFRNVATIVQPAADVTNVLLPVFLITLGVALIRGMEPLNADSES